MHGTGEQTDGDVLPLLLGFVNHQENLELLGRRDLVVLHEPRRGGRLLHHVGDGAEEAPSSSSSSAGLSRLGLPLRGWGAARRRRPGRRGLGRRGSGGGGGRRRRLSLLGPLKVRHVAIGQVGDERAVRETPAQIIHGCSSGGAEDERKRSRGGAGWVRRRSIPAETCSPFPANG